MHHQHAIHPVRPQNTILTIEKGQMEVDAEDQEDVDDDRRRHEQQMIVTDNDAWGNVEAHEEKCNE